MLALGADVPVCLAGVAARMQGIGEVISPLILPPAHVVLVNPGFGLATADVFRALTRHDNPPLEMPGTTLPDVQALTVWLRQMRNDLEPAAESLAPGIATMIAALQTQPQCLIARMSGSGATCFGLFATAAAAEGAAQTLARPGWWVRAAALAG